MSRTWTDNQLDAIQARGGCVTVSAAAGSGKTAVLVERVIRLITDESSGVPADRILVVTYTRLAAAELKERLKKALDDKIANDPENRFLLRQQSLLSKAHISTVDSFCSSLVREFFYILDIDRNFRVADESELAVIRAEAMDITLDTLYDSSEQGFLRLVDVFSTARDDSVLQNNILRIYDFLRSHPFPEKWMNEKLAYYSGFSDASSSVWGKIITEYTAEAIDYMEALLKSSFDTIALDKELERALYTLFSSDEKYIERVREAFSSNEWDKISVAVKSFVKGRFNSPKGYRDDPLKLKCESNRKLFKDIAASIADLYDQTESECLYDIELLYDTTKEMFRAVRLFSENYSALKERRGVADYPDLEHWTLKLLVDESAGEYTDIAREISSRFDEIMVDEFQDANETQDTIFNALSDNGKNLFVVGDVKQSIYGFRQAMPELFLKRKNNAVAYDPDDPVFPTKIILEKNFRSAEGILSAVNFFFEKLMSEAVGDIDYNSEEKLYAGAAYDPETTPAIELDIIDREGMVEEESAAAEAAFVAERILRLIFERYQVKDGDNYRDITFSDIAILMRNSSKYAPVFVDTLGRYGIPASTERARGFLSSPEIMLATNFLRVINNPALDIELLSVMMSPLFGFDEDDLARIRCDNRRCSLYSAVIDDSSRGNEKSSRFLERIAKYRSLSVSVPLSELIVTVYEDSSLMSIASASADSQLPRKNLRLLLEYAKAFENNTRKGLSSFVAYLDKVSEQGSDIKGATGEKDILTNCVSVMSIHASKGLEFPVCFISNTASSFVSDTTDNVLLHSEFGFAVKRRDTALSVSYNTMPRKALAIEISRCEKSEELRILYVAMTRARQKLILTAAPKSPGRYLTRICAKLSGSDKIDPFVVRSSTRLSDWMVMCAATHPDCETLRQISGCRINTASAGFSFDFHLIDSLSPADSVDVEVSGDVKKEKKEDALERFKENIAYRYPYEELTRLPVKVAASTLSHSMSQKSFGRILSTPAFLSGDKLTGAQKGTALHTFMQFADFLRAREEIQAEIYRLVSEGHLSEIQAQSIDIQRAKAFIDSDLVSRAIGSDRIYKEYRFSVSVPASMVKPDIPSKLADEELILQGAVDLAFVENGNLVIADYKTDRVKESKALIDMYSSQLKLYEYAMKKCLNIPVSECIIYSIHLSEQIMVE